MSEWRQRPGVSVAIVVALLVALVAGQGIAAAFAPAGGIASTGRVLGKTSFAYLGGLRTFAAAILWNHLEPVYDGYYSNKNVDQVVEFLPTMRLVQLLDPQFEQSYYNSSFIIARRGGMDEALLIARDGIKHNPDSGLLLGNLTQLLLMQDKHGNLPEMVGLAERGMLPATHWATAEDQFEGYGIFRTVFDLAGDKPNAEKLRRAQAALSAQGAAATTATTSPGGGH